MSKQWFNVDRAGLAALLERRGKSFALFELIQNAFDANPEHVEVEVFPIDGKPAASVVVRDDGEGFADIDHAHTMFARSRRASDPMKRGRFNLGEKLVLACCRWAEIETAGRRIRFNESGRSSTSSPLERGTVFSGELRMTRDELSEVLDDLARVIPPAGVVLRINGEAATRRDALAVFETKLPTEFAGEDGNMRRTTRKTWVEVFDLRDSGGDEAGELLEMGIPVVSDTGTGFAVNVQQKIPLNMDRDNVTPAFMRAVNAAVLNAVAEHLTDSDASSAWVSEAMGDSRTTPEAVTITFKKRFGEHAVISTPNDPVANANAARNGFAVVSGGALSGDAWANVRKASAALPASQVFPTPKPAEVAESNANAEPEAGEPCPTCGQPMP